MHGLHSPSSTLHGSSFCHCGRQHLQIQPQPQTPIPPALSFFHVTRKVDDDGVIEWPEGTAEGVLVLPHGRPWPEEKPRHGRFRFYFCFVLTSSFCVFLSRGSATKRGWIPSTLLLRPVRPSTAAGRACCLVSGVSTRLMRPEKVPVLHSALVSDLRLPCR